MNTELKLYDTIRSYDFGKDRAPDYYLEGIVIGFDGNFIEFALLKRIVAGKNEPVAECEIGCAPQNGASIFDTPINERIVFLHSAPACFSLDEKIEEARDKFRAQRHNRYATSN